MTKFKSGDLLQVTTKGILFSPTKIKGALNLLRGGGADPSDLVGRDWDWIYPEETFILLDMFELESHPGKFIKSVKILRNEKVWLTGEDILKSAKRIV